MFNTFFNYLSGFLIVCTSSAFNISQCLKVHEYMPGYINDFIVFLRYEPYELERAALKK